MYTAKKKYAKCIFNNGNDQTDDLTANYGQIYDRSTKQWSPYDVNDLRITSFTADPASDVYTGSEVTLTAEAASKSSSNVFYKFSVTNASGGSSVVSDFSTAKSVSWTPTAAGSYTVTLDVKDDAGNDNSRTLSLTVAPDTGVTNPIIKKVTPANLNLIKMGSTATVSVTAGGGQTGTNLLFYKYVVTDPNGVPNVPYYTLNNTYQFKPSMKGNYTVDVFVQASDNSTISKTYTYTSTDGNIPTPTEPVTQPQPTTQKPTTTTPVPTTVPATTSAPTPTVAPTTSPSGYRFGDANQDGDVNIMDVTYIQKHCAEYADARTIDLSLADINRDGIMTVSDATALQYILAT